jgi:hypothetical protein
MTGTADQSRYYTPAMDSERVSGKLFLMDDEVYLIRMGRVARWPVKCGGSWMTGIDRVERDNHA